MQHLSKMRAEILLSLLLTKATFGAVANYQTWMVSGNWNPTDVAALLGLNSMVIQKQIGEDSGVRVLTEVTTGHLREQGQAVDDAIGRGFSYSLGRKAPGNQVCIQKTKLPEDISEAYLAAGQYLLATFFQVWSTDFDFPTRSYL